MDNKVHRLTLTGLRLVILGSVSTAAVAAAPEMPAYREAEPYPAADYQQPGMQAAPVPGPYSVAPGRGLGAYGMGPGQGPGGYGPRSQPAPGGFAVHPVQGGGGYRLQPQPGPRGFAMPPAEGPAAYARGPGDYGMGPGEPPVGYSMGPGDYGRIGAGDYGMGPQPAPGGFGAGPGQGPTGYGMEPMQGPGGYGMGPGAGSAMPRMPEAAPRPGMPGAPMGGSGMMGGPGAMRGSGTAMLDSIARLDLSDEQRARLNEIRADLSQRQQELMKRIAAAGEKLHQLYQEQIRASRTMSDLNGHVMQANMDAANRAEELLTEEQRERLISAGAHVMTPQRMP